MNELDLVLLDKKIDKLLASNERIEVKLEDIMEELGLVEESISNLSLPGTDYSIEEQ